MRALSSFTLLALVGGCGQPSTSPDATPADAGPVAYTYAYVRATADGPDVVLGDGAGDILDVRQLEGAAASAALSPDQSQLAVEAYDDAAKAYALIVRPLFGAAADEHVLAHSIGGGTERWSPDGKHLAYASNDGAVYVVDAAGGTPAMIASWSRPGGIGETTAGCVPVGWSPDSKAIVTSTGSGLAVYDVGSAQTKTLLPSGTAGWICSPAWSPDGKTIAFAQSEPTNINSIESILATGGAEQAEQPLVSASGPLQWSPDGKSIAYVDLDSGDQSGDPGQGPVLRVVDAGGGTARILVAVNTLGTDRPQWSSDGSSLLFVVVDGVGDAQLTTISAAGGAPNPLPLVGAAAGSSDPAWLTPPIVK